MQYHLNKSKKSNVFLKLLRLSVLLFFFFLSGLKISYASERAEFYVTPILPESQISDDDSYYNLLLNPSEKETLHFTLLNATNNPIAINVSAHTAFTNVNGVVEYGKDATEPDPTLKWSMDELLKTPGVVNLASNYDGHVRYAS